MPGQQSFSRAPARDATVVLPTSTAPVKPVAVPVCPYWNWTSSRSPAPSNPAGIVQLPNSTSAVPEVPDPVLLHTTCGDASELNGSFGFANR